MTRSDIISKIRACQTKAALDAFIAGHDLARAWGIHGPFTEDERREIKRKRGEMERRGR